MRNYTVVFLLVQWLRLVTNFSCIQHCNPPPAFFMSLSVNLGGMVESVELISGFTNGFEKNTY